MSFDTIGGLIAPVLVIMILSYIVAENPLYRLAQHILVGVAIGYAAVTVFFDVLVPAFAGLSQGNSRISLFLPALFLAFLFALRALPAGRPVSNLVLVFVVAVVAAVSFAGAVVGVAAADYMFGEPVFTWSRHVRTGLPQAFSESVATFGLLAVIWGCSRRRAAAVPVAVGAYITAAYWFTASTSFANPAVTLARSLSDTFAGIRPADAPWFVAAQLAGALAATLLFRWLAPGLKAERLVVEREA